MTGQFTPVDVLRRDDVFCHNGRAYRATGPGFRDDAGRYLVPVLCRSPGGVVCDVVLPVWSGTVDCTDAAATGSYLRPH